MAWNEKTQEWTIEEEETLSGIALKLIQNVERFRGKSVQEVMKAIAEANPAEVKPSEAKAAEAKAGGNVQYDLVIQRPEEEKDKVGLMGEINKLSDAGMGELIGGVKKSPEKVIGGIIADANLAEVKTSEVKARGSWLN